MACPHCGNDLKMSDLFGLMDSFADPDEPQMSIDDLVGANTGRSSKPSTARAARDRQLDGPVKAEPGLSASELMRRMKKDR